MSFRQGFWSSTWDFKWNFTRESWRDYAPFKDFSFCYVAPLPDLVLQALVLAVLLLFVAGLLHPTYVVLRSYEFDEFQ